MRSRRYDKFFWVGLILIFMVSFPPSASGQDYPNKPITLYCGFTPGGTTDLTARGLARGAEKLLGVPVVVENKTGGTGTVMASLLATKKPDGYTIAVLDGGAVTYMPLLVSVTYDPLKDFTLLMQYSRYLGGLCVLSESPIKTIDEFIAYAKTHPGLSYASTGFYSQQGISAEFFAQRYGLKFKEIAYKGGAAALTSFMGKHTDFLVGSGSHIPYVKQGLFRLLLVFNTSKRDPGFPDIPVSKELGCEDAPPNGMFVSGPKGLPEAIVKKLSETFKKVAESPDFQQLLTQANLPYDFKDRAQAEIDVPAKYEWWKSYLQKAGVKKKE